MVLKGNHRLQILIFYIIGVITGVSFLFSYFSWQDLKKEERQHSDKRLFAQEFISPLLECSDSSDSLLQQKFNEVKSSLKTLLPANIKANIYFKDLQTGASFEWGDSTPLVAGSLSKVPLVMSYYKRLEEEPDLFQKKILFDQKEMLDLYDVQSIKPSQVLNLGQEYTIEQLANVTITKSDNVAAAMLEQYDNHQGQKRIALDLNIPIRKGVPPLRPIQIRDYASFFSILFNATYLNRKNSNEVLHLLSQTEYKDGLFAGVPATVKVAHKFGEALDGETKTTYFLNDCGVIYYPERPYVLCISLNTEHKELKTGLFIKEISALFYKKIDDIQSDK